MKSIILVSLFVLGVVGCKSAVEPTSTEPAAAPSASVCVDAAPSEVAQEVSVEAAVVSADAGTKGDVKDAD